MSWSFETHFLTPISYLSGAVHKPDATAEQSVPFLPKGGTGTLVSPAGNLYVNFGEYMVKELIESTDE